MIDWDGWNIKQFRCFLCSLGIIQLIKRPKVSRNVEAVEGNTARVIYASRKQTTQVLWSRVWSPWTSGLGFKYNALLRFSEL